MVLASPFDEILKQNGVIAMMFDRHPIRRGMDGVAVGEEGAAGVQVLHIGQNRPRIRRQSV